MKTTIKNARSITAVNDYKADILIEIKIKNIFKNLIITLIIFLLLVSNIFAGIRGPGKYSGIVIFDQWDTCYLYSGTYLMYIAEKKKEFLRKYKGQSIVIDAKEVSQPMNPGDGLITEFEFLAKAPVKENLPQVEGIKLTAKPKFEEKNLVAFELEVENQGSETINISTSEIAPTLFGKKDEEDYFSPSDGKSDAKITRCSIESAGAFKNEKSFTTKGSNGQLITTTKGFSIKIQNADSLPKSFNLAFGEKRQFTISLNVPDGNYDFLFGYSGGVHEGKSIASNTISFSVDEKDNVNLIETKTQNTKKENKFESNFVKSFFNNFSIESIFSKFQIL